MDASRGLSSSVNGRQFPSQNSDVKGRAGPGGPSPRRIASDLTQAHGARPLAGALAVRESVPLQSSGAPKLQAHEIQVVSSSTLWASQPLDKLWMVAQDLAQEAHMPQPAGQGSGAAQLKGPALSYGTSLSLALLVGGGRMTLQTFQRLIGDAHQLYLQGKAPFSDGQCLPANPAMPEGQRAEFMKQQRKELFLGFVNALSQVKAWQGGAKMSRQAKQGFATAAELAVREVAHGPQDLQSTRWQNECGNRVREAFGIPLAKGPQGPELVSNVSQDPEFAVELFPEFEVEPFPEHESEFEPLPEPAFEFEPFPVRGQAQSARTPMEMRGTGTLQLRGSEALHLLARSGPAPQFETAQLREHREDLTGAQESPPSQGPVTQDQEPLVEPRLVQGQAADFHVLQRIAQASPDERGAVQLVSRHGAPEVAPATTEVQFPRKDVKADESTQAKQGNPLENVPEGVLALFRGSRGFRLQAWSNNRALYDMVKSKFPEYFPETFTDQRPDLVMDGADRGGGMTQAGVATGSPAGIAPVRAPDAKSVSSAAPASPPPSSLPSAPVVSATEGQPLAGPVAIPVRVEQAALPPQAAQRLTRFNIPESAEFIARGQGVRAAEPLTVNAPAESDAAQAPTAPPPTSPGPIVGASASEGPEAEATPSATTAVPSQEGVPAASPESPVTSSVPEAPLLAAAAPLAIPVPPAPPLPDPVPGATTVPTAPDLVPSGSPAKVATQAPLRTPSLAGSSESGAPATSWASAFKGARTTAAPLAPKVAQGLEAGLKAVVRASRGDDDDDGVDSTGLEIEEPSSGGGHVGESDAPSVQSSAGAAAGAAGEGAAPAGTAPGAEQLQAREVRVKVAALQPGEEQLSFAEQAARLAVRRSAEANRPGTQSMKTRDQGAQAQAQAQKPQPQGTLGGILGALAAQGRARGLPLSQPDKTPTEPDAEWD